MKRGLQKVFKGLGGYHKRGGGVFIAGGCQATFFKTFPNH